MKVGINKGMSNLSFGAVANIYDINDILVKMDKKMDKEIEILNKVSKSLEIIAKAVKQDDIYESYIWDIRR